MNSTEGFWVGFILAAFLFGFVGGVLWDGNTVSNYSVATGRKIHLDENYYVCKAEFSDGIVLK